MLELYNDSKFQGYSMLVNADHLAIPQPTELGPLVPDCHHLRTSLCMWKRKEYPTIDKKHLRSTDRTN